MPKFYVLFTSPDGAAWTPEVITDDAVISRVTAAQDAGLQVDCHAADLLRRLGVEHIAKTFGPFEVNAEVFEVDENPDLRELRSH